MAKLDPDAQQLLDVMIKANWPAFDTLTPVQAREQVRVIRAGMNQPVPPIAEVRDLKATGPHGDIPLRLYRGTTVKPGEPQPVLVYFHGGGWVFGNLEIYDNLCRALANSAGCTVISVEYRLAPEHKFPAAVDDCWAALTWAQANAAALRIDPSRIALGGDSAGGNLATVVSMMARQNGAPRIACQILLYPTVDLAMTTDSFRELGTGFNLTAASMVWFRGHYLNSAAEIADWRASPLHAKNLADLPPAYIAVAGCDPLHDEGVAFAAALEAHNVPVTLRSFPGQMHGFASMQGFLRAADEVIAEVGDVLKRSFGTAH